VKHRSCRLEFYIGAVELGISSCKPDVEKGRRLQVKSWKGPKIWEYRRSQEQWILEQNPTKSMKNTVAETLKISEQNT